MQNIKAVIFDLGRVLVSINPAHEKFERLMLAMGIPAQEAFSRFFHLEEVQNFMTGGIGAREFYQLGVDRFNLTYSYDDFAEGWCDLFTPDMDMRELFVDVAAHYPVGILSDTDPLHWKYICGIMPWLRTGTKPTLSYEVGYLKPHPAMFEAAARNCGFAPDQCLFIDDLMVNVDGARFCGMPALQFSGAAKLRKDLTGLKVLQRTKN